MFVSRINEKGSRINEKLRIGEERRGWRFVKTEMKKTEDIQGQK